MPIWKTTPVADVPQLRLANWLVAQLPDGDRHLAGYNLTEREGRVSSCIQSFDVRTRRAVTWTGRVYELVGSPGLDGDGLYTWNRWKSINHITEFTDVTPEVWAEMEAVAEAAQEAGPCSD